MLRDPANEKYVKSGVTVIIVAAICLVMTYVIFNMDQVCNALDVLGSVLGPFVYGAVIAYLLAPMCNRIEKMLVRFKKDRQVNTVVRFIAVALALIATLTVVVALIILVVPEVTSSAVTVIQTLPDKLQTFTALVHGTLSQWTVFQQAWDSVAAFATDQVDKFYGGDLVSTAQTVLSGMGGKFADLFDVVKNLFFGVLISVYMLASRRRFASQSKLMLYSLLPGKWASVMESEVRFADKMFNGFLVGKILDSCIIAAMCFIGCLIMQIESAAFISVLVLVLNIIPFFGPILAGVACGLLLLIQNPVHCVYWLVFFIVLQQFDGNILGPKIIGNTTGLSGFWVLFSILLFGGLWGVVGMVVGIPLFAVIYDILRRLVDRGLEKREHMDMLNDYRERFPESSMSAEEFEGEVPTEAEENPAEES